jgi:hypothetical protein
LEELVEDVVHVLVAAATASLPLDTLLAALVVELSLLRVGQYLVSIGNFLKLFLCFLGVLFVLVRMELDRQFLERFLNLTFFGVSVDAQGLVVVLALLGGRLTLLLLLAATASAELLAAPTTEVEALRLNKEGWAVQTFLNLTRDQGN